MPAGQVLPGRTPSFAASAAQPAGGPRTPTLGQRRRRSPPLPGKAGIRPEDPVPGLRTSPDKDQAPVPCRGAGQATEHGKNSVPVPESRLAAPDTAAPDPAATLRSSPSSLIPVKIQQRNGSPASAAVHFRGTRHMPPVPAPVRPVPDVDKPSPPSVQSWPHSIPAQRPLSGDLSGSRPEHAHASAPPPGRTRGPFTPIT